jgi:hypothetical protein
MVVHAAVEHLFGKALGHTEKCAHRLWPARPCMHVQEHATYTRGSTCCCFSSLRITNQTCDALIQIVSCLSDALGCTLQSKEPGTTPLNDMCGVQGHKPEIPRIAQYYTYIIRQVHEYIHIYVSMYTNMEIVYVYICKIPRRLGQTYIRYLCVYAVYMISTKTKACCSRGQHDILISYVARFQKRCLFLQIIAVYQRIISYAVRRMVCSRAWV